MEFKYIGIRVVFIILMFSVFYLTMTKGFGLEEHDLNWILFGYISYISLSRFLEIIEVQKAIEDNRDFKKLSK
jgi:hypothetical protein